MIPLKLLVVSHPCLEEVNRAVYRYLASNFNVPIHLAIPRYNDVGDGYRECLPVKNEPFEATLLEPRGRHLRLRRLEGLSQLVERLSPSHILVDADPSTLIVNEMIWVSRKTGSKVWAMTAENLPRNYLQEAAQFAVKGQIRQAVSSVMTWGLMKGATRGLDRLFTISRDGTQAMERMGFEGRVTQIPLGFDPRLFHPQGQPQIETTRRQLGLSSTTIAYFGRLSPEKGIDLLLEAVAEIKDLKWQLLLDQFSHERSPYIRKLESMIENLGLKDRVVFFESSHAKMGYYMNAADIVVLPSISTPRWKEQYGRVVPEAMACGKVVVGANTGTIPELIADAGYLFPERDVRSLSQLLRRLIVEPSSMGKRAAERASRHLSIHTQAETWFSLLGGELSRQKKVG